VGCVLNYRGNTAADQNNLFNDIDAGLWKRGWASGSWPAAISLRVIRRARAEHADRAGLTTGKAWSMARHSTAALFPALDHVVRRQSFGDYANVGRCRHCQRQSAVVARQREREDRRTARGVYFVSPKQINVQAPAGLATGW